MIGCLSDRARKEVICTANILKINDILGNFKSSNAYLFSLAERCDFIIEKQSYRYPLDEFRKMENFLTYDKSSY